MKITKRQLRRIIKEEKARISEAGIEGGIDVTGQQVMDGVYQFLEDHFDYGPVGTGNIYDPEVANMLAQSLRQLADRLEDDAFGRNPGGSIG
tara:strand:+ start:218 stop:493 length:276 start_codon:yes stop_codon:yes gene_type:complete